MGLFFEMGIVRGTIFNVFIYDAVYVTLQVTGVRSSTLLSVKTLYLIFYQITNSKVIYKLEISCQLNSNCLLPSGGLGWCTPLQECHHFVDLLSKLDR